MKTIIKKGRVIVSAIILLFGITIYAALPVLSHCKGCGSVEICDKGIYLTGNGYEICFVIWVNGEPVGCYLEDYGQCTKS